MHNYELRNNGKDEMFTPVTVGRTPEHPGMPLHTHTSFWEDRLDGCSICLAYRRGREDERTSLGLPNPLDDLIVATD